MHFVGLNIENIAERARVGKGRKENGGGEKKKPEEKMWPNERTCELDDCLPFNFSDRLRPLSNAWTEVFRRMTAGPGMTFLNISLFFNILASSSIDDTKRLAGRS